jgi:hypothetical protein
MWSPLRGAARKQPVNSTSATERQPRRQRFTGGLGDLERYRPPGRLLNDSRPGSEHAAGRDFEAPADVTYAELRARLEAAGTPIGGNDMLVAARRSRWAAWSSPTRSESSGGSRAQSVVNLTAHPGEGRNERK